MIVLHAPLRKSSFSPGRGRGFEIAEVRAMVHRVVKRPKVLPIMLEIVDGKVRGGGRMQVPSVLWRIGDGCYRTPIAGTW